MTRKEIGIIEELYHYYLDCKFQSETEDEADFYQGIMDAIEELEDRLGINSSEYWLEDEMKLGNEDYTVIAQNHYGDHTDDYTDEVQTLEEAHEIARNYSKDYSDVYIRRETEYIYKLS